MTCSCNSSCTCSDTEIKQIVADAVAEQSSKFTELTQQAGQSATAADGSANEAATSASQAASSARVAGSNATAASESANQSAQSASASASSAASALNTAAALKVTSDSLSDTASKLSAKVDSANVNADKAETAAETAGTYAASALDSKLSAASYSANAGVSAATASSAAAQAVNAQTAAANSAANAAQDAATATSAVNNFNETVNSTMTQINNAAEDAQNAAESVATAVSDLDKKVASTATNAQSAATSATDAATSAVKALAYVTAAQSGIVSYSSSSVLLAAVPTSDQVGLAVDTDGLYYFRTATGSWTNLDTTFANYVLDISNIDKALNSTAASWVDTSGTSRPTWKAIQDAVKGSNAALAFASATELLAFVPATANVLALDTATGTYYYWNGTAWSKTTYQVSDVIKPVAETLQRLYASQQLMGQSLMDIVTLRDALDALITTVDGIEDNVDTSLTSVKTALQQLYLSLQVLEVATAATTSQKDFDEQRLLWLTSFTGVIQGLTALEGLDVDAIWEAIEASKSSSVTLPVLKDQYAFPAPESLIRINLTSASALPTAKGPVIEGSVDIYIDGQLFSKPVKVDVQGATSAAYAKKNLNLAFFTDATYEDAVDLKIGDVKPHDEWTFKANWIDATNVRNTMNYNLWAELVDTRTGWPQREIDFSYVGKVGLDGMATGATAYPQGYPCVMYFNGEFYGIGDLMLGKKRGNYNIAKNDPTNILFGLDDATVFENLSPTLASIDLKAPSKITNEVTASFTNFTTFVKMEQEAFTAALPTYLDTTNIVDFYLFIHFLAAVDCVQKNTLISSYDGVKFIFNPYDLDTTYGLHYAGTSIAYAPTLETFVWGTASQNITFWRKVRTALNTEIEARYKELREKNIFTVEKVRDLATDLMEKYTPELYEAEQAKWPAQPSWTLTSLNQILDWTKQRLVYLDSYFNYSA